MKYDSHQQCLIVHGLLLSKNQFPNVLHKNTKLMQSLQSFWEFYPLYHCHITLTGKIKLILLAHGTTGFQGVSKPVAIKGCLFLYRIQAHAHGIYVYSSETNYLCLLTINVVTINYQHYYVPVYQHQNEWSYKKKYFCEDSVCGNISYSYTKNSNLIRVVSHNYQQNSLLNVTLYLSNVLKTEFCN